MTWLTELADPRGGDHAHAVLAHVARLAVGVRVAALARLLPEHGEAAAGHPGARVHAHRARAAVLVARALARMARVALSRGLETFFWSNIFSVLYIINFSALFGKS